MELTEKREIFSEKLGKTMAISITEDGTIITVNCSGIASPSMWMDRYWEDGSNWYHNAWEDHY